MDAINFLNLENVYLRIFTLLRNFDIEAILNWVIEFIKTIRPIAILLTLFMIYVIVYSHIRLKQLSKSEEDKFHAAKAAAAVASVSPDTSLNEKWAKVQTHINSNNPSDWRLAILEADIMLDEMLDKLGYQGDSLGEKLKSVDRSEFLTIDQAWEAHKIRNRIAHEGADFKLNEREAKTAIDLYRKVFEEFYHI